MAFAESPSSGVPGGYTQVLPVEVQGEDSVLRGHVSEDVAALVDKGVDQMNRHDLVGASNTFMQVLKADPGNKYAWYNLGVIAHQGNKLTSARRAYEKALKTDPMFGPALYNQALLVQASDPDRAIALLKRAIASDPKASTAYFLLGEILAKRGSMSEAKDAFILAVTIDPQLRSEVPPGFLD
ncbi:tetratricopeptide repeat protein [Streptomyces sp. NPDC019539]|uniref:tetratricopeptide repeat protein n=1 Tax=Streptomyces sp. NPDC019539 TaxID=3365063 RepID=UPI0037A626B3